MDKKILVTVDTEMDADIHWHKNAPATFSSVLDGIPRLLRPTWNEFEVSPIYFVSPEVVGNEACCMVLRDEVKHGAIIGAHLHPEYIEPEAAAIGTVMEEAFPCYGYEYCIERDKIRNLQQMIRQNIGVEPIWYRAARFGADLDTIKILEELGFKYDSSFTPGVDWTSKGGPDHSKVPLNVHNIGDSSIMEYPVTIGGKRWGILGKFLPENWLFRKWLRPTHMTYLEEGFLLDSLSENGVENIVMMFHSMELMINKTPYVRNKFMQDYYIWRMKKTISYAREKGYRSYRQEDN